VTARRQGFIGDRADVSATAVIQIVADHRAAGDDPQHAVAQYLRDDYAAVERQFADDIDKPD
jgi:hypothetical protein